MGSEKTVKKLVFCPVCDKVRVPSVGKKMEWRQATEEEQTERAIGDGDFEFDLKHCPDCGGSQSDRLTRYGERDEGGNDLGTRDR